MAATPGTQAIERPLTPTAGPRCAKPLVAVDRILHLDASGVSVEKAVAGGEYFFQGHYPGYAIYPGVFIIETVHQAVSLYLEAEAARAWLEEVRSTRFLSPIRPGDVLACDCRCSKVDHDRRLDVSARCRNGGLAVATVRLSYRLESHGA